MPKQHSIRCRVLSLASGVLLATGALTVAGAPAFAGAAKAAKAPAEKPAKAKPAKEATATSDATAAKDKPAKDPKKDPKNDPKKDPKKDPKASGSGSSSGSPGKGGSSASIATDPKKPVASSTTGAATGKAKKPPVTPGQCGENSFLGSAIGAGSTLGPGSVIRATYHDETPLNRQTVVFTIDGAAVQPDLKDVAAPKGDKFATQITITLTPGLLSSLGGGTHTAHLRAEDTDQNKAGGDCGEATFTFASQPVAQPQPPPQAAPPAPPAPAPPAVLGTVVTRAPAPVAAPAAPAAPARLALTGSSSLQLGLMGLALLGAGAVLRRTSRRPARPTRFRI